MDEQDVIPRGEAIAGLALLGVLAAALVGTIVFRIVDAAPRRSPQIPTTTWASESDARTIDNPMQLLSEEPQIGQIDSSSPRQPAAPIPIADDESVSIPAASTTHATPLPSDENQPPTAGRPHFVAPAGR
jgi:hypothetical protein